MKTFVAGATGFIGTRVARKLLASNDEILSLVGRPSSAAQELEQLGGRLVSGDVTDRASLDAGMQGCSQVIHIAGFYSVREKNPAAFRAVNVEGTRNVMEAALASGVSKVVHVSTVGVCGKPADVPFSGTHRPGLQCSPMRTAIRKCLQPGGAEQISSEDQGNPCRNDDVCSLPSCWSCREPCRRRPRENSVVSFTVTTSTTSRGMNGRPRQTFRRPR